MPQNPRAMIVFPTGQTASKNDKYFDVFSQYIATENIKSSLVVYPKDMTEILSNAASLTKRTSLVPVPMTDAFSGTRDFPYALKIMFSTITRSATEKLHIVTSGGTTKIGNLAVLAGNLAERFGLEVKYLWAARDKHGIYQINPMPRIIRKEAAEFDIKTAPNGDIIVEYTVN